MTRRVYLRAEAEEEIGQAAEWYAERGLELASAFLDEVSVTIAVLQSTPEHYSVVEASSKGCPPSVSVRDPFSRHGRGGRRHLMLPYSP